jgi:diguanylate cyclase (GGDEF)-like protein/PAS domain S-box-containing protein
LSALATKWAVAVLATSHVALPRADIESFLLDVATGLVEMLHTEPFDPQPAAEAGKALVGTNLTGNQTLNRTMRLLGRELLDTAGLSFDQEGHERLTDLLGSLTAGYVEALRERLFDEQEMIKRAVFRARDIAEVARNATEARWRAVFHSTAAGIAITDLDGCVRSVNPALREILGASERDLLEHPLTARVTADHQRQVLTAFDVVARGEHDKFVGDISFVGRDDEDVWTRLSLSLVRDAAQEPEYAVAVVENISDLHLLRERQLSVTLQDQLTKLPNRTSFMSHLDAALQNAGPEENVAICYVDLDGFKIINDGVGHNIGDKVLRRVANTLSAAVPEQTATVARIGGDGFAVLLTNTSGSYPISERITAALEVLAEPDYEDGDTGVAVSASVGIVERPASEVTSTDLVRAAELTVHRAKQNGKAQWELYDDKLDQEYRALFQLGAAIPGALENGQFQLSYQPVRRLEDDRLVAFRAQLRWHHPTRGVLEPGDFLDMAEETGFIVPMGRWVLDQVCERVAEWADRFGDAAMPVGIHLTARLAREEDLVQILMDKLAKSGAPATKLLLSLPAGVVVDDHGEPLENLGTLHDIGVRAVVHGFGNGNAGLVDLRHLPVDAVSIAPDVIRAFGESTDDDSPFEQGLRHVVEVAGTLGKRVLADGVDTIAIADRLRAVGIRLGFGAAMGGPLSSDDAALLMNGHQQD